jgi:hypothetical protein
MLRTTLFGTGLLLLAGCSPICRNDEVVRVQAPDGLHVAIMFQRDCGATTAFSTQISVVPARGQISGSGNAFVADGGHAAVRDGASPWAEMRWLDKDHLLIRFAAGARIFEQAGEVSGVRIRYQPVRF